MGKRTEDRLVAALHGMLTDYRSEGCPDENCKVCAKSKVAEKAARDAIAAAELTRPSPKPDSLLTVTRRRSVEWNR